MHADEWACSIHSTPPLQATAIVENARSEGLAMLYGSLNITETEHKASFDYLRTLLRKKNLRLHVGFSSAVAGPFRT